MNQDDFSNRIPSTTEHVCVIVILLASCAGVIAGLYCFFSR